VGGEGVGQRAEDAGGGAHVGLGEDPGGLGVGHPTQEFRGLAPGQIAHGPAGPGRGEDLKDRRGGAGLRRHGREQAGDDLGRGAGEDLGGLSGG
jgi:hypothetical protein